MVPMAPVVADARISVHNQGIDLQLDKTCSDRNPSLSSPYDEHGRIVIDIFDAAFLASSQFGPRKSREWAFPEVAISRVAPHAP